jgi:hypothetical protein
MKLLTIKEINDKIDLFSILIGFFVVAAFLFIGSIFYSIIIDDFFTNMLFVITTAIFFGGFTIGAMGCSDYDDALGNSVTFLLIITNVVGILIGVVTMFIGGMIGSLSNNVPTTSIQPSQNFIPTNSSFLTNYILNAIILFCSAIFAGIIGCYLAVYLKNELNFS